jgi:hypothetical protein
MIAIGVHLALACRLLLGLAQTDASQSETALKSVEQNVLVVRHGVALLAPQPGPTHVARSAAPGITPEEAEALNRLADLGLITIRKPRTDARPSWAYRPKVYGGYHAKPQWTYHGRAGWLYNGQTGWRYRPEPDWAESPGAVQRLLQQLPTAGENWYVTRWQ